ADLGRLVDASHGCRRELPIHPAKPHFVDGPDLAAEHNTVLPQATITFLYGHDDWICSLHILRPGNYSHDRSGRILVTDVVLNDDARTCLPLFVSNSRIEIDVQHGTSDDSYR